MPSMGKCPHSGSLLQDSVSLSVKWLVEGHPQLGELRAGREAGRARCPSVSGLLCSAPASRARGRGGARAAKAGALPG